MRILTEEELRAAIDVPLLRLVGATADRLGLECYVIGGFVRDLFLERPSADVDCVVVGSGIKMAQAVADDFQRHTGRRPHVAVYQNFGTAQISLRGVELEFVGARRESYDRGSRKPFVEDGTLEDDQNRRDFTINALALCLNADRFGQLTDPFGGLQDLQDGIIRTPLDPEVTFSDDPLRMMRCIRFATQLDFRIDDETFDALTAMADRIAIISGERIIEELNKIMLAPHPSKGLIDMERCGLLERVLPEVAVLEGVETMNGRGHKDNFYHTLGVLENVVAAQAERDKAREDEAKAEGNGSSEGNTPEEEGWRRLYLRWAALLHDIGKAKVKQWSPRQGWTFHNHDFAGERMIAPLFRRLHLPLDERMKYVQKLVGMHMRPQVIADEEVTDSAVRRLLFDAGDDIDDLMTLCEADITSKNLLKKQQFLRNFQIVREKLVAIEEKDRIRNMKMPVTGDEIMARFHLPPSRPVGELKEAMKNAILDGVIPNEHDAALAFVDEEARKRGLAAE